MKNIINFSILEHQKLINKISKELINNIDIASKHIVKVLKNKKTIFLAGNGGSAADSQHIAAELVGQFKKKRKPLKAIALTTDTSNLTAIGNDFGYTNVFKRQLAALGEKGDLLISISTSGKSKNIIDLIRFANQNKIFTISLLGKKGGNCKKISKLPIIIPSDDTARIQEMHILVLHIICEIIDKNFS